MVNKVCAFRDKKVIALKVNKYISISTKLKISYYLTPLFSKSAEKWEPLFSVFKVARLRFPKMYARDMDLDGFFFYDNLKIANFLGKVSFSKT
jgi:hypothetical protein